MKLKKHLRTLLEQQTTADLTRMANTIRVIKLIRRQKLVVATHVSSSQRNVSSSVVENEYC